MKGKIKSERCPSISFVPPSAGVFPRRPFFFCVAILRKVAQAFEGGGPILFVLGNPRGEFGSQRVGFQLINLLPSPARCGNEIRCPQTHQVFGDSRCHQAGELSGQLTHGQWAAFDQEIEDKPARRVGQNPE
jgi:hypothetical protein